MTPSLLAAYQSWPLLFWLAGSVLVYALVTTALWLGARALSRGGRRPPAVTHGLAPIAALVFFVGVPYLALGGWPLPPFSGLLSPVDMGLAGLGGDWPLGRWLKAAGTGLALGLAGVAVLWAGWALANAGGSRLGLPAGRAWQVPIRGVYVEVHWSFYRAALGLTLADVYAGTWAALALILLEWSLNPAWRQSWRDPARAGHPWLGAGLALLSTLVYLLTHNLWICIAVHWLVAGTLTAIAHRSAATPEPAAPDRPHPQPSAGAPA